MKKNQVNSMNSWKSHFDNINIQESTSQEAQIICARVDFLIQELGIAPGDKILDIGCGDGKYLVEFAKNGFEVTGLDFSSSMLEKAKQRSITDGVKVKLINAYAQHFESEEKYDAVISLNQGAFCLLEKEDSCWAKDMGILANMASVMPVAKKYAITFLNAFYLAKNNLGKKLDLFTLTQTNENGLIKRYYTPTEVVRMVNRIGLKADKIYSAGKNHWNATPASFDDEEFIVIGHRKDHKGRGTKK